MGNADAISEQLRCRDLRRALEEGEEEPQPDACPSLKALINEYFGFGIDDERTRKFFEESFGEIKEVNALFKILLDVEGKPIEDQIKFFTTDENEERTTVIARIAKWLSALARLVDKEDVRAPALTIYGFLLRLLLYIDCIHQKATGKKLTAITRSLKSVAAEVKEWEAKSSNWLAQEQGILAAISKLLSDQDTAAARRRGRPVS